MNNKGPLSGIKAVTCSTAQAGTVPYALMADLGAEIIKIELPNKGDGSRNAGEVIKGVSSFFETNNMPSYRANQVYNWLWKKSCLSFDEMTNVSLELRNLLKSKFVINHIKVDRFQKSKDGTIKNAILLFDNLLVESVLIPTKSLSLIHI